MMISVDVAGLTGGTDHLASAGGLECLGPMRIVRAIEGPKDAEICVGFNWISAASWLQAAQAFRAKIWSSHDRHSAIQLKEAEMLVLNDGRHTSGIASLDRLRASLS